MKSLIYFGFYILVAIGSKAQTIQLLSFSGNNLPVAFASILFYNDTLLLGGTYADENGIANLILPLRSTKIEISCIGFRDTIIKASNLNDTFYLYEEIALLNEIVVYSDTNQSQIKHLGFTKAKRQTTVISSPRKGTQVVTRIDNPYQADKKIKAIEFWIKKNNPDGGFLKLVFFEIDSFMPGKQIGFELIFSNSEQENTMLINVEDHNISLPKEGFFMGIEWMSCMQKESTHDNVECINKIIGNFKEDEIIKNQVYVRDKFEHTNWIDLNAFAPYGSFLPAFGIYVYE